MAAPLLLAQQYPFVRVPGSPTWPKALLMDHQQRLWVGDQKGLSYFDGSRFLPLATLGLPRAGVFALSEDSEGAIWAGTNAGIFRYLHGQLETVTSEWGTGIASVGAGTVVAALAPGNRGTTMDTTLYRIVRGGDRWVIEPLPLPLAQGQLHVDHDGSILYPSAGSSWCEVKAEAVRKWQKGSRLEVVRHFYHADFGDTPAEAVLRDRFGCVWLRSRNITRYQCPGDAEQTMLPLTIAERNLLAQIHEAPDGTIIIPSEGLLAVGRPGAFKVATAANGLPQAGDAVLADHGTIWIAGEQGLYRFLYPFRIEYWTDRDGLTDPRGPVRLGKDTFLASAIGVMKLSEDRKRWLPLPGISGLGRANHLLLNSDGTLFAALGYHRVAQFRPDGTIIRQPPAGLRRDVHLAQTADGQIWAAGSGVERLVLTRGRLDTVQENVPAPQIAGYDVETDRANRLWSCYAGGLVYHDTEGWHSITTKDGLLQNGCLALTIDHSGDVWYAYSSVWAFSRIRIRPPARPEIRNFRQGEVSGALCNIFATDSRGWLWRGADGMYVADVKEAAAAQWLHLDDGLPFVNMNSGSFYDDPDGSVWFSAGTTLKHFYPPADLVHPIRAPNLFISAFSFDHSGPKIAEAIGTLPHGKEVRVHIGTLQTDRRNALQIRYRLLPRDKSWHYASGLDVNLPSPAWGGHMFEVQGRIAFGPWSQTVSWPLTVAKPLWLSWWSLAMMATTTLVIAFWSFRSAVQRAARAKKALPDLTPWQEAAAIPELHDLAGTTLDSRFQLGRFIARGGFATVVQGLDLAHGGRRCAVKVMHRELLSGDSIAPRFLQEISALEALEHPNVVRIYGHGATPDGCPYLAMEFIHGQTLRRLLENGPITPKRAASLIRQTAAALQVIHARGIYHRDLKPENIMIRAGTPANEDLVLIDFSIAIIKDPNQSLQGLSKAAGTVNYMAPEHSIGYADASTDLYNLAKLVIEMLTAQPLSSLITVAALDLPARVRRLLSNLPWPFTSLSIELIGNALEFDPSRRLHDVSYFARVVADDLERTVYRANSQAASSTSHSPFPSDAGPAGS